MVLTMPLNDEKVGGNLSRLRGDMSQKDFASRMRERGWKWSQATVWSVEKGERPLRFTEALDVVDILGVELATLVGDVDDLELEFFSSKYTRAIDDVRDELRKAIAWQLEIADAMDGQGVTLTTDAGVHIGYTVWQAFTVLYTNLIADQEITDDTGAFRRAVIEAWRQDAQRVKEEWYGEHQEEA
jgi:transcriptional regulator with XRE-family HTH domain